MLRSIRNTFCRTGSTRSVPRELTPPVSVVHAIREASHTRSLVVIPRHPVKGTSAPLELDPPSTRAFQRHATNGPEMRPADFCNPHVKDEHPTISRGAWLRTGIPDLARGWCVTARPPASATASPPQWTLSFHWRLPRDADL